MPPERFELSASDFGGLRSVQLSYGGRSVWQDSNLRIRVLQTRPLSLLGTDADYL